MEAKFVRPVSYPYDVDAGLQAVVLLQADLLFVLHYRTAHADDNDLLTLWSLDIQAAILCIDFHALNRFDTRRIFFFFRTFGFDVDVGPDIINGVFARLRAFLQFVPSTVVVAALVIDLEVIEGVANCVFLDIDTDRTAFAHYILAGGDFHAVADFFYIYIIVADGIGVGCSGLADAYREVYRTPIGSVIVCGSDGSRARAFDLKGPTVGNRHTSRSRRINKICHSFIGYIPCPAIWIFRKFFPRDSCSKGKPILSGGERRILTTHCFHSDNFLAGQGDGDLVVVVIGRPGHRDGDGVLLVRLNAAAAGVVQDAAGDAHAGHIVAGGLTIAGPVGEAGQLHFAGPVGQNGAGGGCGPVIGPLVDGDGCGHAGSVVVVVVPGLGGGDSDATRLGGGQDIIVDGSRTGLVGNGEDDRAVAGAAAGGQGVILTVGGGAVAGDGQGSLIRLVDGVRSSDRAGVVARAGDGDGVFPGIDGFVTVVHGVVGVFGQDLVAQLHGDGGLLRAAVVGEGGFAQFHSGIGDGRANDFPIQSGVFHAFQRVVGVVQPGDFGGVAAHGCPGIALIGQGDFILADHVGHCRGDDMGLAVVGERRLIIPLQHHVQGADRPGGGVVGGFVLVIRKGIVAVFQRHGDGGIFALSRIGVGKCRRDGVVVGCGLNIAVEGHALHRGVGGAVVGLGRQSSAGDADFSGLHGDLLLDGAGAVGISGGQGVGSRILNYLRFQAPAVQAGGVGDGKVLLHHLHRASGGFQLELVELVGTVIGQFRIAGDDRVGVGHGKGAAACQRSLTRQAGLVRNVQGAVVGQGVAAHVQGAARRDGEGVPVFNGEVIGQGIGAAHGAGLVALAVDQPAAVSGGGQRILIGISILTYHTVGQQGGVVPDGYGPCAAKGVLEVDAARLVRRFAPGGEGAVVG